MEFSFFINIFKYKKFSLSCILTFWLRIKESNISNALEISVKSEKIELIPIKEVSVNSPIKIACFS